MVVEFEKDYLQELYDKATARTKNIDFRSRLYQSINDASIH